jgi:hypothetical protein
MRFSATILLPVCLTLSAWSQLTFTVPVMDKSAPGSPLEISGTASFTEQVVANSVTSSSDFRVDARNVSGKAIIFLLAYFDDAGPHGGGTHHVIEIDHFFRREVIAPGQAFVLARSAPGGRTVACCINPLAPADEPKADVSVEYVQFADGSSFGDETTAKDILQVRSVILEALQRLDGADNEQKFLAVLGQKVQPHAADGFLEAVRYTRRKRGTAARAQVRSGLTAAEEHAAATRAVQSAER